MTHLDSILKSRDSLEPIIQRKASQKEKDKHCILTHIYGHIYTESRRMVLKSLCTGQQRRNREQTYGRGERGGEGEMYEKSGMETYITTSKIDSQQEFSV